MSRENVEKAKRALGAVGAADYESALALMHPDVELFPPGAQEPHKGAASLGGSLSLSRGEGQATEPVA